MNEVSFSSTSGAATVGVGESKVVSFDGTYLRTAGIQGQVSVDGEGLGNVTVTLTGGDEDATTMTDTGGLYAFSKLKSGTYQVAISGYDTDDYEFQTTSKSVTIATGETTTVPFEGTLLRTAGIAGRVSVEGMGIDGVTVTLAGAAEATVETANGGQYAFAGLAAGTYVLTITNPDEVAYNFDDDNLSRNVVLADDQSAIENFEGTHTRTASISGVLFIDEVMDDKERNDGEPTITEALGPWLATLADDDPTKMAVAGLLASAKVTLRGPDLNTETDIAIMPDGSFTTGESLMAGSYQVELPANDDDVAAALEAAGVAFVGESMVVTVDAGGSATADFPFRITKQTLTTGARMGGGDVLGVAVPGVKLALFARADMAGDPLGEATTDEMGAATFNFARDDNTGPTGNDNIVFVKVMESGHDALAVSGNEFVEIVYESTERLSVADADKEVATLINVAVNFDFWVKSNEDARNGDEALGGWTVQYCMPMAKTDETDAVVCEGDDAAFMDLMMGEGDDAEPVKSNDGKEDMANLGKVSYSSMVTDPKMLPVMVYVRAKPVDVDEDGKRTSVQPDDTEKWEQGDALMHTHTGLDLPPGGDEMPTDLGPIRITYTTQAVYVGTHRELDDRTGFTNYIGVGNGDARPTDKGTAIGEIEVTLMEADSRGRLNPLTYDHDFNPENDDVEAKATFGKTGIVSFTHIPADKEITIVVDEPAGMMIVPDNRATREIDAFGDQLDDYPEGVMVGAFGEGSGARPDVWICPLSRLDREDPNDHCSTFAYKWATGTVSGKVTGLRKGDEDVAITLTPVTSNEDYAGDLVKDLEVDYSASGTTYKFTGVADGRYQVALEAVAGKWKKDVARGIEIEHDESNKAVDYEGDVSTGNDLSATDLRGVIKGVIANDASGNGRLTSNESTSGVTVNLHYATAKINAPGTANHTRRRIGDAVMDSGSPVTAETDRDGVFTFTNIAVDTVYVLMAQESPLYTVVRNGNTSLADEKSSDVVSHALVTSVSTASPDKIEVGTPRWNYDHSNTKGKPAVVDDDGTNVAVYQETVGANDFVLLYKNGEVEGEVSDPSVRGAHEDAIVELHLCKTTDHTLALDASDNTQVGNYGDNNDRTRCDEYEGTVKEVPVNANMTWGTDGLREGVWEVVVDLPAGYVHVDSRGRQSGETSFNVDATTGENNAGTFFSEQIDELKGGRASWLTKTFHVKDRSAGSTAVLTTSATSTGVHVSGGTSGGCVLDGSRCIDNEQDDATISVTVRASTGATVRLSTSATDAYANTDDDWSVPVRNGRATTVRLEEAGSVTFYVHIAAEDGYSTNLPGTATNPAGTTFFAVRRNADIRAKTVTVQWSGGGIELDRRELGLDPVNRDGETGSVLGRTIMNVTVGDSDDGRTVVPTGAGDLSLDIASMGGKFGNVPAATFGTYTATATDPCASGSLTAATTFTLPANPQSGSARKLGVCFTIVDTDQSDGSTSAGTGDHNAANTREYLLILTRGKNPS